MREPLKRALANAGPEGVWVAVQNRGEDDSDQYWIGRAVGIVREHTQGGTILGTGGRVRYDVGDLEVEVLWYERDVSGGDERRTFIARSDIQTDDEEAPPDRVKYTFNSSELRLIKVNMRPVEPLPGPQLQTIATRLARVRQQVERLGQYAPTHISGVVRAVHTQRATPPMQLWTIDSCDENLILGYCCP